MKYIDVEKMKVIVSADLDEVVKSIIDRQYDIISVRLNREEFESGKTHGVIAVEMPNNGAVPFVTWEFTDYTFWGHYHVDYLDLCRDFTERAIRVCGENAIRVLPAM